MNLEYLAEPQSRRTEVGAGLLALLAGVFALGFATWLAFFDPTPLRGTLWVCAITVLIGGYSLVLARRLLAAKRPRYLMSPLVLLLMGLAMLVAAIIQAIFVGGWQGLEAGTIGAGALLMAWRRLRRSPRLPQEVDPA